MPFEDTNPTENVKKYKVPEQEPDLASELPFFILKSICLQKQWHWNQTPGPSSKLRHADIGYAKLSLKIWVLLEIY